MNFSLMLAMLTACGVLLHSMLLLYVAAAAAAALYTILLLGFYIGGKAVTANIVETVCKPITFLSAMAQLGLMLYAGMTAFTVYISIVLFVLHSVCTHYKEH